MARIIKIFESPANAVKFTAEYWLDSCRDSLLKKGWFSVALSGGRTPVHLFREMVKIAERDLWKNAFLFQVDERFVPRDHEENNFAMIERELVSRIEIPAENLFPVPVKGSLRSAASKYEKSLKEFFRSREAGEVSFDLIILGIGEDGHTASLFPGSDALNEKKKLVRDVETGSSMQNRITFTFPLINVSKRVIMLAPGESKAAPIKGVLEENDRDLPASHIVDGRGEVIFVLDRGSASMLDG
jgi:6-phosphogluconolactonase